MNYYAALNRMNSLTEPSPDSVDSIVERYVTVMRKTVAANPNLGSGSIRNMMRTMASDLTDHVLAVAQKNLVTPENTTRQMVVANAIEAATKAHEATAQQPTPYPAQWADVARTWAAIAEAMPYEFTSDSPVTSWD